jgi:hypothetical protein
MLRTVAALRAGQNQRAVPAAAAVRSAGSGGGSTRGGGALAHCLAVAVGGPVSADVAGRLPRSGTVAPAVKMSVELPGLLCFAGPTCPTPEVAAGSSGDQPGGGAACTKLPHFGQARICPTAAGSMILSRAEQVVQAMRNGFTVFSSAVPCPAATLLARLRVPAAAYLSVWRPRSGW